MSLLIAKKGWLCTIQDLGRPGYAQYGINRSGVMDPFALQMGNYLLGNPGHWAALEMCFPAPVFVFLEPALILVAGADFSARLDDQELMPYQVAWAPMGSTLSFAHKVAGQYAYLCIRGGLDTASWLKSQSTHLKAAQGGWQGRNLKAGDIIPLANAVPAANVPCIRKSNYRVIPNALSSPSSPLRFIPGQHYGLLEVAEQAFFSNQEWRIAIASDRMGYRLEGKAMQLQGEESLLSAGLSRGTIQLPPNGQPIVLMADHQTTGGYPVLGQVIQADWPRLAQLSPGAHITFQAVDLAKAAEALSHQLQFLRLLKRSASWALETFNQW